MFESFDFSFKYIFVFITFVITFVVFSYDKIKDEGWEVAYIYLNKSALSFIRWGKNENVIKATFSIRDILFKLFWISLVALIVIHYVNFLNFLITPIVFIMAFSFLSVSSFNWVFNHKEQASSFFNSIKIPIIIMLALMILSLFFSVPTYIEDMKILTNNQIIYSYKELYIGGLLIIISMGVSMFFGSYLLMWIIFGTIPTSILILFYILTKSAVLVEKMMGIKKLKTLLVLLNILAIFIATFYKG